MAACSKWEWLIPNSTACAAEITSLQWSLPNNAAEVGFIFQIDSGSAGATSCKLQELIGNTWTDVTSAVINTLTIAGAARYFLTTHTTGILRVVVAAPTLPVSLKVSAAVIWSTNSR